ncbi:MAG: ornithine carbamoyltransferase [Candidatus Thorarchaeota archaeon]|nr:MAG: ornithine carbamoyltransferase [Candidatus Thorarchaeota archaeon]
MNPLYGRNLITTQEWTVEELERTLKLALEFKQHRFDHPLRNCLDRKTFFMFFYNPSVRTRQSFECAATELGGHAQFLEPKTMRLKSAKTAGETVQDAANVMSRYACGIGIRILETAIEEYGQGDALLREYAEYASVPIISMAHDRFHPCQGLADVMGMRMHAGKNLKGKKLVQVWAKGALVRSWCSVQESILINTRMGMDVTLAYPEGYNLDREVIQWCEDNASVSGGNFEIVHDLEEAYDGANFVYSRNWMSPHFYEYAKKHGIEAAKKREIEMAMKYDEWITTKEWMARTDDAFFIHCGPVDRGSEVTNEVVDGPQSIVYDIAENRLHVQKAIMALTMGIPDSS